MSIYSPVTQRCSGVRACEPIKKTFSLEAPHPAELLQQPVVLLGEFADGLCLVPVGLPQLDLVALQLALQMLDVRLQLGDAAFPLPLSTLKTPTQLVLLLLQVLRVNETNNTSIYVSNAQNI